MSPAPDAPIATELKPTPFRSLRNVPLWMDLLLALAVAALIRWAP